MKLLKAFAAGGLGACIGAIVWAFVAYWFSVQIGIIALGLGFLAGFGAVLAVRDEADTFTGAAAAAAMLGILGAKLLMAYLFMQAAFTSSGLPDRMKEMPTDEDMIAGCADVVAQKRLDDGKTITWPAGVTFETADKEEDYPRDIWTEAKRRRDALDEAGKEQERQKTILELEEAVAETKIAVVREGFRRCFGRWDFLWVPLAVLTAFRIGGANNESE